VRQKSWLFGNLGRTCSNLRLAIAHSCNSFFCNTYRLIVDNRKYGDVKVGYQKWHDYMNAFGLGTRLGLDLPSEDKGGIPDTTEYDKIYRGNGILAPTLHWDWAR
jgi:penicillin-binding protein 2